MKSDEDHENGKFAAGIILGALIGASLAILFAPKSGEETRKIIKNKAKEYFDKGKEIIKGEKAPTITPQADVGVPTAPTINDRSSDQSVGGSVGKDAKEAVKKVIDKALD